MPSPLPLTPLRSVLCATDLESDSGCAVARATWLARQHGAELHALHVVGGSAMDSLRQWLGAESSAEQALVARARDDLNKMLAPVLHAAGVRAHAVVLTGAVPDQVIAAAHRVGAELLVVGAGRTKVLRRVVLGSTADRLLRRGHRPVLVARQAAVGDYARVLVAVDFSCWSPGCLAWAQRIAPQAHCVLHHVWSVPFEEKLRFAGVDEATVQAYEQAAQAAAHRRLHDLAAQAGLSASAWTPSLVRGDAGLATVQSAQELDCDLIVIGKHGGNAAQDLLLGSVTRQILCESMQDVLVTTQAAHTP
ncbi:MAG: universal stress protein [Acidovorax sp.]|nr:universal stress protein [Acidovorax sp.]